MFSDWLPIAAIALFISALIVSLAYMLSKGFHLPALEAWSKVEYRELVVTTVLIAGLALGMGLVDIGVNQLAQGPLNLQFGTVSGTPAPIASCTPAPTPTFSAMYDFAQCYLAGSADYMLLVYNKLLDADRYVAKMTSFYYNIAIPLFLVSASFSGAPYAGLNVLSSLIAAGLDALAAAIFIQSAQSVLLQFFWDNSFRWILPLGIVLRTFTFSRKLGATLIAIAIGTYVVYPMTLVFAAGVYSQPSIMRDITINLPHEPPDLQDTMICNQFVQEFTWLGSITWWFIWYTPKCVGFAHGYWVCMLQEYPKALSLYSKVNSVFLVKYASTLKEYAAVNVNDIYYGLVDRTDPNKGALAAVSHDAMITAALAVFSIIITLSATRSLSQQLGGDSQFYGIYKLI
ncbi:Uncharacterised protein [Candidatus Burarchaeum australiense]|nr:Uncharacterised protein [Candidatus Burarchaeum australiense]